MAIEQARKKMIMVEIVTKRKPPVLVCRAHLLRRLIGDDI